MELRWLRTFVQVATDLNYRRAAATLHISQPAVSQQINRLEESVGVRLVERTTRATRLTRAGEAFLPFARQTLATADAALRAARNSARDDQGIVRIGFAGAMAAAVAADLARGIRNRHPGIELQFRAHLGSRQVVDMVRDGELEIGFAAVHGQAPGLRSRVIRTDPFVLLVPSDHRLAGRERVALAELGEEPFVFLSAAGGLSLRDDALAACAEAGLSPRVMQEAPDTMTTFALVAAGVGVTVAPLGFVADIPGTVVLTLTDVSRTFSTELIWHDDRAFGALHLVLDAIAESVATDKES